MVSELHAELTSILGNDGVVLDAAGMEPFAVDQRRQYKTYPLAIAMPQSVAQVSAVVALCGRYGVPIVPHGGNTGYCGGATPRADHDEIVVSLQRLRAIRQVDPENYSMVVEAGCVLADVQRAATEANRLFPLGLGSEGSCQIGGNIGTNAGGTTVLRYGMMRDLVLGIEVVLPDGALWSSLKGLRKDNTGYDLKGLFVGAEGTLGIVTAATLKLFPPIRSTATAMIAVPDVAAAAALLSVLREECGDCITSFELISADAAKVAVRGVEAALDPFGEDQPWRILCELGTSRADDDFGPLLLAQLERAMEDGVVTNAVVAQSGRERAAMWRLREAIPEGQRKLGFSVKHDVAVPISALAAFYDQARAWIERNVSDVILVVYGHVGDGNLHFNLSPASPQTAPALERAAVDIRRAVHDIAAKHSGTFSAEHGIGISNVAELERLADPVELGLMRCIKHAIDPRALLNPGKVLGI